MLAVPPATWGLCSGRILSRASYFLLMVGCYPSSTQCCPTIELTPPCSGLLMVARIVPNGAAYILSGTGVLTCWVCDLPYCFLPALHFRPSESTEGTHSVDSYFGCPSATTTNPLLPRRGRSQSTTGTVSAGPRPGPVWVLTPSSPLQGCVIPHASHT